MSKHYHCFFSYRYGGEEDDSSGWGHVTHICDRKINGLVLDYVIYKQKKHHNCKSIVITFFSEIECDCEGKNHD